MMIMEDEIKKLPAKKQLQHRAARLALTCAIMLIINHQCTPELNWGLWVVGGLCVAFLYDLIDYFFVKRNELEE